MIYLLKLLVLTALTVLFMVINTVNNVKAGRGINTLTSTLISTAMCLKKEKEKVGNHL